jgi:hypothetical protein
MVAEAITVLQAIQVLLIQETPELMAPPELEELEVLQGIPVTQVEPEVAEVAAAVELEQTQETQVMLEQPVLLLVAMVDLGEQTPHLRPILEMLDPQEMREEPVQVQQMAPPGIAEEAGLQETKAALRTVLLAPPVIQVIPQRSVPS